MMGGSFSPRALTISNTVIRCLAYFPPLHLPFFTESDLSGNACQKSPVSSAFHIFQFIVLHTISGNRSAQDSNVSAFNSPSSPATLNCLTLSGFALLQPSIRGCKFYNIQFWCNLQGFLLNHRTWNGYQCFPCHTKPMSDSIVDILEFFRSPFLFKRRIFTALPISQYVFLLFDYCLSTCFTTAKLFCKFS